MMCKTSSRAAGLIFKFTKGRRPVRDTNRKRRSWEAAVGVQRPTSESRSVKMTTMHTCVTSSILPTELTRVPSTMRISLISFTLNRLFGLAFNRVFLKNFAMNGGIIKKNREEFFYILLLYISLMFIDYSVFFPS